MAQEIIPKTDETQQRALLARVDGLIETARESRAILERTYLDIGVALKDVQDTQAWLTAGFHSFDSYVREWCEPRFDRKRNQLYSYKTAAEQLLPHFDRKQLGSMGVTKAVTLAGYVKKTGGKKPPAELSDNARNPQVGVDEFRADVAAASHTPLDEKGKWFEFGGAFLTPAEREEIERGFDIAERIEPLPAEVSDWQKRKIVMQRLVAEFLSAYGTIDAQPQANGRPTLETLRNESCTENV